MALLQVSKNRVGPLPRDSKPDHAQFMMIACFYEYKLEKKNNWKIITRLFSGYLYFVIF